MRDRKKTRLSRGDLPTWRHVAGPILPGLHLRVLLALIRAGRPLTVYDLVGIVPGCGCLRVGQVFDDLVAFRVARRTIVCEKGFAWNGVTAIVTVHRPPRPARRQRLATRRLLG